MITLTLQLTMLIIQLVSLGLFMFDIGIPYTNFIAIWGVIPVLILGLMQ